MGPQLNDMFPPKRQSGGGSGVAPVAEVRVILLPAKECQQPPEAERRGRGGVPLGASAWGVVLPTLCRLLASGAGREYISVVLSHPFLGSWLWQPEHVGPKAQ